MGKYLLDSHTLIWYLNGDTQLSEKVKNLIEDAANEVMVSIGSYWEIAIKISIGKLNLPLALENFVALAKEKDIQTLPISEREIIKLNSL